MKGSFLVLCALLFLLWASTVQAAILDKRVEQVTWFKGNTYCYERIVDTDSILIPTWSGSATLVDIFKVSRVNVSMHSEEPVYKCDDKGDIIICNPTGEIDKHDWVEEQVNLTSVLPKTKRAPSLSTKTADAVSKEYLAKSDNTATVTKGEYRYCFKATGEVDGHIEYMAVDIAKDSLDICKSTLYNITSSAIYFGGGTSPNGTVTNINYTQPNVTMVTDNLDTFKQNWNGTNYSIYDSSLVFALNLDNNSAIGDNGTIVRDISSYQNNATFYNGSTICGNSVSCPTYSTGKYSGGVIFDGVNDNLQIPTKLYYQAYSDLTFCSWFYMTTGPGANRYIAGVGEAAKYSWGVRVQAGSKLYFTTWSPGGGTACETMYTPALLNFTWYHVCATWNNATGTCSLYLNGTFVNSSTKTTQNTTNVTAKLYIGQRGDGSYWNGSIDEVRIYNRVLSALEIAMQYDGNIQRFNTSEYRFWSNQTIFGIMNYSGWANDTGGNSAGTDNGSLRYITFDNVNPVISLDSPQNISYSVSNISLNFSYVDVNQGVCWYYLNSTGVNTTLPGCLNTTLNLSNGFYLINLYANDSAGNNATTQTANFSINITTTSTTTTTGGTTTTLAPITGTGYVNQGSLWIYSFIFPGLAIIFTICAFYFKSNFLPPMFAGFTWFICTFTTRSIIFIDNYTVSANTYYVAAGNPEYNWIYIGLGVIMFLYGVFILLIGLKNQGIKFGEKEER